MCVQDQSDTLFLDSYGHYYLVIGWDFKRDVFTKSGNCKIVNIICVLFVVSQMIPRPGKVDFLTKDHSVKFSVVGLRLLFVEEQGRNTIVWFPFINVSLGRRHRSDLVLRLSQYYSCKPIREILCSCKPIMRSIWQNVRTAVLTNGAYEMSSVRKATVGIFSVWNEQLVIRALLYSHLKLIEKFSEN